MRSQFQSIRPFIGAQNFEISRSFYKDLGFEEIILEHKLSCLYGKKQDSIFRIIMQKIGWTTP
jgi:L-amino acid N-acyltransferase YncA